MAKVSAINTPVHVVLVGDSIFDNASYVDEGDSVVEQLQAVMGDDVTVTLIAVDGSVTTDVSKQLADFPDDASHVIVSCGGNDALSVINILDARVNTVGAAMRAMDRERDAFRSNYSNMLEALLERSPNLVVCTVYNNIPGLGTETVAGLALFNEIILEEAIARRLPVIDLRNLCQDVGDYSATSPIEPSAQGGKKIAKAIQRVVALHAFGTGETRVYV
ncbi:GDSL-lilke lipase/acylhydrolase family protein [Hahella chejuensis KCTC 2396]|uniref:GDSL-lilke lipase/acylhydrolase family protein n=1 Tax=Hahella chejuensis (strain KCTC 2396) TaxID=349521 RepID=Q2S860_HAHCH|nr:SGNH/GDSL hydrolase family protein [Hahella chejuensis]ABC33164.1 GDSL-lilke lipase/acylhydrolase family protein [Hahella chejuensis KCTC 2396]